MRVLFICAIIALSACAPHAGPRVAQVVTVAPTPPDTADGWERGPGVLMPGPGPLGVLELPDTVLAGRVVAATVTTAGPSSCTRPGGADVQVTDSLIEIRPYDLRPPHAPPGELDYLCTADIAAFPRAVMLPMPGHGGVVRVRVYGAGTRAVERIVQVREP